MLIYLRLQHILSCFTMTDLKKKKKKTQSSSAHQFFQMSSGKSYLQESFGSRKRRRRKEENVKGGVSLSPIPSKSSWIIKYGQYPDVKFTLRESNAQQWKF